MVDVSMTIKKVKTGITGLDAMLRGGVPEGRMALVMGGPGTGKTILASQFLYYGATNHQEKTLYISLDESKSHFMEEMLSFGWDFQKLEEEERFVFIDASAVRRIPETAKIGSLPVDGKQLARAQLLDSIFKSSERERSEYGIIGDVGAHRIVLDSISGLLFRFPEVWEKRQAILDIMEALDSAEATCLITSEALSAGEERQVQPEEYLSHGAILLRTMKTGERSVQVLKMRGTEVDSVPRPYRIGPAGIEVYPEQSIFGP